MRQQYAFVAVVTFSLMLLISIPTWAQTVTYDLKNDWSDSNNPNGVWAYRQGTNILPHQTDIGSACCGGPGSGIAGGWAPGSVGGNFLPFLVKTVADDTAGGFLAGDVILHGVDEANGNPALGEGNIAWTAPVAGTINISGSLFYAQLPVSRSADFTLTLGAATIASGTITSTNPRSTPVNFSGTSLSVQAGDVVTLQTRRSSGQTFGTIVGINLTIVQTVTQPTLSSIRPTSGAQGKTLYLRMTGTNFVPAATAVEVSGAGVAVAKVNVDGAGTTTNLTAKLVIDPAATPGPREVRVSTAIGGTSNAQTFTVRAPSAEGCSVSLPLTASGSWGNLYITAGIGTNRTVSGTWAVGWMVFNPTSVSFQGIPLLSGTLSQTNPPLTRSLSTRMAGQPAVAVVNAFYNPNLCGYSLSWASTQPFTRPHEAASRSQIDAILDSIDVKDFDGESRQILR